VGPALHALISRALATFAHTIVPWGVEQEHAGRLIYAGGDDVLAMAPAADALRIVWRLRQLFQSLWVVDTQPLRSAWDPALRWQPAEARGRFVALSEAKVGFAAEGDGLYKWLGLPGNRLEANQAVPVCPMLGPHHSLSAGIAVGHFKTPLRELVEGAESLNQYAKNELHRSAVAIGVFTRGGMKYQGGGSWRSPEVEPTQSPPLISNENFEDWWVERLRQAYADGGLPSRLPHKLRRAFNRLCSSLSPAPTQGDRAAALPPALRRGALTEALDGEPIDPGLRGLLDALVVGEAPEQALRLLATLGAFVPEEAE
jgi:CRISPR-associated protein Cmr2